MESESAYRCCCRVLDEKLLSMKRNKILILCAIALSLDPLFCYILVVDDERKCLRMDRTLRTVAIVSRSGIDFLYIMHTIFQFCATRSISAADILAILPLPQVLVFAVIPKLNDLRILKATKPLNFIFVLQYVLRFLRICSLLKKELGASGILAKSTLANLFFFMLASHVIGAFWFLFSVERKATCWLEACSHVGVLCSLLCDNTHRASTILNSYCSKSSTFFDFGIYNDALSSGVVDSADILQKISYCFWWGLQNLSSLGQSLKASTYVWEVYFSIFVSISGLLSFAFLIGNLQAYLLSEVAKSEERRVRVEEMRLKRQEMESWRPFLSLPENLREQILRAIESKLQENILMDVHNFLHHIPMELRKDTIRHLGRELFKRVPLFDKWSTQLLDAICDSLKPVIYTEESYIFKEEGTVDAMLFVAQGKLLRLTTYGGTTEDFLTSLYLGYGDFCGEELIAWAFCSDSSSNNLPTSSATVQCLSRVLALVLKADDLKLIAFQFRQHDHYHNEDLRYTFRYNSLQWRIWAACFIQQVWRRYGKRKFEKEEQNRRLHDALVMAGTSSSSLGDTIG